jgi:COP9 signalosome complex subunit 7
MDAFLILANNTKDKAAVQLIQDCLESNVYQFDPLLHHPNIQQLRDTNPDHYRLLEIFAHGTWQDYHSQLPPLTPKQSFKLKQLTLISQAHKKVVAYKDLLQLLDLASIRELEDLIIQTIEQELIMGKLDQKKVSFRNQSCLFIESAIGRLNINIMTILSKWYENTGVMIQAIDEQIESCQRQLLQKEEMDTRFKNKLHESQLALDKK